MRARSLRDRTAAGYTLLELLLAMAIGLAITGAAVPLTVDAMDEIRTTQAARYLEGRVMDARMQAIRRSTSVALRFEAVGGDYLVGEYRDGNGNGIRTADIGAGIDVEVTSRHLLRDLFPGVSFGLRAELPDADGRASTGTDGVRLGSPRLLSLSPDGTASSGTLYVRGRRAQYAVRVLGATGRTRLLRYESGRRQWLSR